MGIPVINAFNLPSWLYNNVWITILGSILVVGFTQEFLKYAAVRFSVFSSNEFDERVDGIIYSTAAGLGFATAMNITFIVESGGVDLTMAAIRVVLVALAQASFAGVTGYFMGRDKLEDRPAWWMPLGVTIAAVLNGLFYYLWGTLKRPSFSAGGAYVNPWTGLILAAVLAVAIMAVLTRLIDRDQQRTLKMLENKEA
jgi:RsiW-degrading membrane proteinase PrsW (M82 family)